MPFSRVDLERLALDDDRDLDGQLFVSADEHEVDVAHRVADRVPLEVLDDRQLRLAVDLQVEQGVEARVGGQRRPQVTPVDRHRDRVGAVAVDHGRDLAFGPKAI